jgi:hypothetical protein
MIKRLKKGKLYKTNSGDWKRWNGKELIPVHGVITYKVSGWVHPKEGGDDYKFEAEVQEVSEENVRAEIQKWLRKRSAEMEDFVINIK